MEKWARFTVPGEPVAKQRPRVTKRGTYTPQKTQDAEELVGWSFKQAHREWEIDPEAFFSLDMRFFCSGKPRDLDNLIKVVMDGLNEVAWKDDRQVVEIIASRTLTKNEPETQVCLYRL